MLDGEDTGAAPTEAGSEAAGTSLIGDAPAATEGEPQTPPPEGQPPAETDEARAAREAEEARANETPEQKAEREAKEALTADAPEAYTDFTVPEGIKLDAAVTDELKALGKDANWSQARTQQVVDLGAKLAQSIVTKQQEGFAALRETWQNEAKADAEYGGAKLQESLGHAAQFRDAYGTPKLTELLNESGLGDHPEVVRLFARAGKALSDATFVNPGKTAAERQPGTGFYTNSNMKD